MAFHCSNQLLLKTVIILDVIFHSKYVEISNVFNYTSSYIKIAYIILLKNYH